MRRREREITDTGKLRQVIESCQCCRVGFADAGQAYIVPLNFGYVEKDGKYTFYFHSAKEGRKIELIREKPLAGFEMDTNYALKTSSAACGHSAYFQSIIGSGQVCIVEDEEEKRLGLQKIMEHAAGNGGWEFEDKMLNAVCVWKLAVSEMTGKENLPG